MNRVRPGMLVHETAISLFIYWVGAQLKSVGDMRSSTPSRTKISVCKQLRASRWLLIEQCNEVRLSVFKGWSMSLMPAHLPAAPHLYLGLYSRKWDAWLPTFQVFTFGYTKTNYYATADLLPNNVCFAGCPIRTALISSFKSYGIE